MTNQAFGMVIGEGGADAIIKAMSGLLRAKGGELFLNSRLPPWTCPAAGSKSVTLADGAS